MDSDILKYFISLVQIDSESRDERAIADFLINDLKELGAEVCEDNCCEASKGNAGNIFARFSGDIQKKPIMFCAHIDTVVPGKGVQPQIREGKVFSDGTTILGGDDKSGVAEIMMGIKRVLDADKSHAPIEVLFTVSEEIGLLGAKCFDPKRSEAAFGYAFDAQNVGELVLGAPSQHSLQITITGKEAHAGVEPEKGINAIRVAAEAIAAMPIGRIDSETTTNIGVITGGLATNIVPNKVVLKGEARSHNQHKLDQVCESMRLAVEDTVARHQKDFAGASYEWEEEREYRAFRIGDDEPAVSFAVQAFSDLGIQAKTSIGGGGSDANILNAGGIPMIIVGTGMMRYHTVNEYIKIEDLEMGASFVERLILNYSVQ